MISGGNKCSAHYYDLWNIKYLRKFKWDNLTEEIGMPFVIEGNILPICYEIIMHFKGKNSRLQDIRNAFISYSSKVKWEESAGNGGMCSKYNILQLTRMLSESRNWRWKYLRPKRNVTLIWLRLISHALSGPLKSILGRYIFPSLAYKTVVSCVLTFFFNYILCFIF